MNTLYFRGGSKPENEFQYTIQYFELTEYLVKEINFINLKSIQAPN
jgi:hypothetical protein